MRGEAGGGFTGRAANSAPDKTGPETWRESLAGETGGGCLTSGAGYADLKIGDSGVSLTFGANLEACCLRSAAKSGADGRARLTRGYADLNGGRELDCSSFDADLASGGSGTTCAPLRAGDADRDADDDCDATFSLVQDGDVDSDDEDCAVRRRLGRLVVLRIGREDSRLPIGKPFPSLRSKSARASFTLSDSSSASSCASSSSVGFALSGVEMSVTAGAAAFGSSSTCVRTALGICAATRNVCAETAVLQASRMRSTDWTR